MQFFVNVKIKRSVSTISDIHSGMPAGAVCYTDVKYRKKRALAKGLYSVRHLGIKHWNCIGRGFICAYLALLSQT